MILFDETYTSDHVGLLNSPILRPIRPNLDPIPDGISDVCAIDEVGFSLQSRGINRYRDHRREALRNDAILINLLSGGRAVYVARTAAMELLASDHKISMDNSHPHANRPLIPFTILERSDELAPQKLTENSMMYKKSYSGSTVSSISAQLGDVTQLTETTTANVKVPYINSNNRSYFSKSSPNPPLFQVTQATQSGDHTPRVFSPIKNLQRGLPSSNRPHYRLVKACYRGEDGKSFKRKNEMIRHDLQHESLGYVCPYCVYRRHKYPRPDNLQR